MVKCSLTPTKNYAFVGEEIGLDLGKKFIKSYIEANPNDLGGLIVGGKIITEILAQPGCVGLKFYNAYNEFGKKTLVYVGIDVNGNDLIQIVTVSENGELEEKAAIIADRAGPPKTTSTSVDEDSWWSVD